MLFGVDSSGICHRTAKVESAGLQQCGVVSTGLQRCEVSFLPVVVGLRPQCRPTSRSCVLDDCLCDIHLGLLLSVMFYVLA